MKKHKLWSSINNPALWEIRLNGRIRDNLREILKGNANPKLDCYDSEPSVLIIDVNIHFDTLSLSDDNSAACQTHERVIALEALPICRVQGISQKFAVQAVTHAVFFLPLTPYLCLIRHILYKIGNLKDSS